MAHFKKSNKKVLKLIWDSNYRDSISPGKNLNKKWLSSNLEKLIFEYFILEPIKPKYKTNIVTYIQMIRLVL